LEAQAADIWKDVLRIDRIGRHDNFFALGGHSLLAVKLIERMRQAGLNVDVRMLFLTPTVAAVAAALQHGGRSTGLPSNRAPETHQDCAEARQIEIQL
jgi:arthrofactin-type cyclic lipopeptide synthetase B